MKRYSRQLVYVADNILHPYLSYDVCVDLMLLSENFPSPHQTLANVEGVSECSNSGVPMPDQQPCGCLKREPPPETPPVQSYLVILHWKMSQS